MSVKPPPHRAGVAQGPATLFGGFAAQASGTWTEVAMGGIVGTRG
jgi:hypothetical protein